MQTNQYTPVYTVILITLTISYYYSFSFQLAFLPFAYVLDSWRWKLFEGKINDTNMNEAW